jgi:hypothetical protein
MAHTESEILDTLTPLMGLPLSIARNAASMKCFHFGKISPHPKGKGKIGEYALHVQCPWRFVRGGALFTGSQDAYQDYLTPDDPEASMHLPDGNRQQKKLHQLLQGYDPTIRSITNTTGGLIVTKLSADVYGGLSIEFTQSVELHIFPDISDDESWRFLRCGNGGKHFVV